MTQTKQLLTDDEHNVNKFTRETRLDTTIRLLQPDISNIASYACEADLQMSVTCCLLTIDRSVT